MKKLMIVFSVFMLLSTMAMADVNVSGILQGEEVYTMTDDATMDFNINRTRFFMKGDVNDNVSWCVQFGENMENFIGVLDAKFMYYCPTLQTTFTMGRFKPAFTYYMPKSVADLDMINYPLMVQGAGMMRQVGIQTATSFNNLKLNVGLFNGAIERDNWTDTLNDGKDIMGRLEYNFNGLDLGGYFWMVNAIGSEDNDLGGNRMGFFATYSVAGFDLVGEYLMTTDNIVGLDNSDVNGASYMAHVGYKFMDDTFEGLFRYENWDPDTDTDNDAISWMTLGLNYYLDGPNSMFYLNYIIKTDEDDAVEIDDNQLLLQYQIMF